MKISFPHSYRIFLGFSLLFFSGVLIASALDVIDTDFSPQSATSIGSNESVIWFSTGGTATGTTSYWNKNNDSDVIDNYFQGYYYDTQFGFFLLNWNVSDVTQNVRIVSSTNKCGEGYGYKLAGYAYSEASGFIKFDYNNDIFVYYCESDKHLHGYAYSEHLGFQNFEGLNFEIFALAQNPSVYTSGNDPFFVNNTSLVLMGLESKNPTDIQGESIANEQGKEVIFYIVK